MTFFNRHFCPSTNLLMFFVYKILTFDYSWNNSKISNMYQTFFKLYSSLSKLLALCSHEGTSLICVPDDFSYHCRVKMAGNEPICWQHFIFIYLKGGFRANRSFSFRELCPKSGNCIFSNHKFLFGKMVATEERLFVQ